MVKETSPIFVVMAGSVAQYNIASMFTSHPRFVEHHVFTEIKGRLLTYWLITHV
jgi:hypothetical protein